MHYVILFLLLCAALYLFFFLRPAKRPADTDPSLSAHYAHRGYHNAELPENSPAAFRNAVEHGYGIELDIQLSSDGEVMVFHDYTLDRMTGETGKLSDHTAAELSGLHLLTCDGVRTEEHIPTLREVLALVDGKVPLLIELKGETFDTALCPAADRILQSYHGAYCVESFNPLLIGWYKKNRPDVYRGLLYTDVFRVKSKSLLNLLLSGMMLNFLARPHFIAYDGRFDRKFPLLLATKLFRADRFLWTVRAEEERSKTGEFMIFETIAP